MITDNGKGGLEGSVAACCVDGSNLELNGGCRWSNADMKSSRSSEYYYYFLGIIPGLGGHWGCRVLN
jgi:hypothetical protein